MAKNNNENVVYAGFPERFYAFMIDFAIMFVTLLVALQLISIFVFHKKIELLPQERIYETSTVVLDDGGEQGSPTKNKLEFVRVEEENPAIEKVDSILEARLIRIGWIIVALYYIIFTSSKRQCTIGQQRLGLMVIHVRKGRMNPLDATTRFLAQCINNMLLCVGYLPMFFRKDRATLHDLMSSSRVIKIPKEK